LVNATDDGWEEKNGGYNSKKMPSNRSSSTVDGGAIFGSGVSRLSTDPPDSVTQERLPRP